MSEYQATGNVTNSAMKAGMSRRIARKYLQAGQPPQELQAKHTWRTREDPLVKIWPQAQAMLEEAPDLEAKALFEYWWERSPWAVQEKHLRTFQRRVKLWRLAHGPDKEVFFPQDWEAGRAMQLDWTNANELAVTVGREPYDHLLCHCVLPHSNWDWATPCLSESLLSCRQGLQETLHRLGKAPGELRVDNSSAATHRVGGGGTGREFNEQFTSLCEHYGLVPRTIGIGCPNENGDVESSNGHLKRRLRQHLLLRGSRDFDSEADYEGFLHQVLERGNRGRQESLAVELAVMKPLPPTRLSEYDEVFCSVGSASTIRVKKVGYSVPARLIGQELKVEVYERELKLY
ncbi:MAG TPA: IS21 family transposase, partial [Verrucomicrobiae bacterium]